MPSPERRYVAFDTSSLFPGISWWWQPDPRLSLGALCTAGERLTNVKNPFKEEILLVFFVRYM